MGHRPAGIGVVVTGRWTPATIKHACCVGCSYCELCLDFPPIRHTYSGLSGLKLSATLLPLMPGTSQCPRTDAPGMGAPLHLSSTDLNLQRGLPEGGRMQTERPTNPCSYSKSRKFLDTISMATPMCSPPQLGWLWRLLSNMLVWVSHQRPVWGGT